MTAKAVRGLTVNAHRPRGRLTSSGSESSEEGGADERVRCTRMLGGSSGWFGCLATVVRKVLAPANHRTGAIAPSLMSRVVTCLAQDDTVRERARPAKLCMAHMVRVSNF